MAMADPCGLGEAVQALRAMRVGGLWVWDHSGRVRTPAVVLVTTELFRGQIGEVCYDVYGQHTVHYYDTIRTTRRAAAWGPRHSD